MGASPRSRLAWVIVMVLVTVFGTACGNSLASPFPEVEFSVTWAGDGTGTVTYLLNDVPRTCQRSEEPKKVCDRFREAGGGGSLTLTAVPDAGSVFVEWQGCDVVSGISCTVGFDPGERTFGATVRFDLEAGPCVAVKAAVPNSILGTGTPTPLDLSAGYGEPALVNPSIEQVVSIGTVGQLLPNAYGYWQGDRNSRVAAQQGITPADGSSMLQFIATGVTAGPTGTAEVIQLVKVSQLEPDVAAGLVRATLTAAFNRVAGCDQTDTAMLLVVAAMTGDPADAQARWSAGLSANIDGEVAGGWLRRFRASLASDADPATWQDLQLVLDVPPGTTYLVVDIGASENVSPDDVFPELHGHYLDDVSLVFTRLP